MELHTLAGVGGDYYGSRFDTTAPLLSIPVRPRDLLDRAQMLTWFAHIEHLAGRERNITVVVDDVPGRRIADPIAAMRQLAYWLNGPDGWITPDLDRSIKTGWSTWVRTNAAYAGLSIHLGVLPMLDADRTPVFKLTDSAQRIAMNLTAYRAATGGNWRQTGGVSGCSTIRQIIADTSAFKAGQSRARGGRGAITEPRWRWDDKPMMLGPAGDLRFGRRMTDAEQHGYVHQLDIRSQYLAAAGAAVLPYGLPMRTDNTLFDPSVAGYWDIRGVVLPEEIRPWAIDISAGVRDSVVVTTPVMGYLLDHGINPEVIQAWTAATSARILRPWTERMVLGKNSVLDHSHPDVRAAWKRTYTETIGMMAAPGGSICRSDWRDMITDLARVNLLRKLDKVNAITGTWPIKIYVDSVWIYSEDDYLADDVLLALGAIDRDGEPNELIGKFRHIKTTPASEYAAAHNAKMGQR